MERQFIYIPECDIKVATRLLSNGPEVRKAVEQAGLSLEEHFCFDDDIPEALLGFTPKKADAVLSNLGSRVMTLKERQGIFRYLKANNSGLNSGLYNNMSELLPFELVYSSGRPLVISLGGRARVPWSLKDFCEKPQDYNDPIDPLIWLGVREVRDKR